MIRSLTKDDLRVEADGWVALLKEQTGRVDRNKIEAIEEMHMIENGLLQDAGSKLPTVERRSGEDRCKAGSQEFLPEAVSTGEARLKLNNKARRNRDPWPKQTKISKKPSTNI